MSDIKIIISILSKHINLLFNTNIKPELFRLAKYNKSENNVVETFWCLLSQIIGGSNSGNNVLETKRYFLTNLKYNCILFYSLPEDMSYGSRELLVAFSYLLAHDFLNILVKSVLEDCPFNPNYKTNLNCNGSIENISFNLKQFKYDDDYTDAMMWMQGRIVNNTKAANEHKDYSKKLLCNINTNSKVQEAELSHPEIMALNSSEHGNLYLENTKYPAQILQNHEKWLRQEHIFWEWMSTVLLERQKDQRPTNCDAMERLVNTMNEA